MTDINETIAEVLRLGADATPGPWDEDGIYMGLRHLGKHCSDWYYRDSDGNLIEVPLERDATLIAYYRTAAPALAREVQRLQGDVERLCVLVDYLREEEEPYERDRLQAEVQRLQAEVERLRPRPSFCVQCLYDLAGSDCCPECGAEVQDSGPLEVSHD